MLTPLTSIDEMRSMISAQGVVAFSDHNSDGFEDVSVVQSCVDFASAFLGGAVAKLFTLVALATSPVMREFATVVAIRTLCMRRGNPIPESIELRYQEIVARDGLLAAIVSGAMQLLDSNGNPIPGLKSFGPVMSNLLIDRRFLHEKVRVRRQSSTDFSSKLERDSNGISEVGYVN